MIVLGTLGDWPSGGPEQVKSSFWEPFNAGTRNGVPLLLRFQKVKRFRSIAYGAPCSFEIPTNFTCYEKSMDPFIHMLDAPVRLRGGVDAPPSS